LIGVSLLVQMVRRELGNEFLNGMTPIIVINLTSTAATNSKRRNTSNAVPSKRRS